MDSAHFDDRNSAHSATDRNVTNKVDNSVVETAKLKEDHDKQIQKLTLENKIKFLESENNHRMKIMQLEKDNQSLTHELELLKVKTSHVQEAKKVVVDREMEKEMLKQQNEFQNKLAEKDKELAEKKNEFDMKLAEVENTYKLKIAEIEKQHQLTLLEKDEELKSKMKDLKIETTSNELISIKELLQKSQSKFEQLEIKMDKIQRILNKTEILSWGGDKFFASKPVELNLFASYQEWYKEISSLLHGEKEIVSSGASKYVFMKRDCGEYFKFLWLAAHRKGRPRKSHRHVFYIEDDEKQFWKNTTFMLLHPLEPNKCLAMIEKPTGIDYEQWNFEDITDDFYYGEEKSAIIFGIFNKLDDQF